jgi:hypothetical protein
MKEDPKTKQESAWRKEIAEAAREIKALAKKQITLMNVARKTPPSKEWRSKQSTI